MRARLMLLLGACLVIGSTAAVTVAAALTRPTSGSNAAAHVTARGDGPGFIEGPTGGAHQFFLRAPFSGKIIQRYGHLSQYTGNGISVSRSGATLYYVRIGKRDLQVMARRAGHTHSLLIANGEDPAVSPDGRYLVYVDETSKRQTVSVRDLRTGATRTLSLAAMLGKSWELMNGAIAWAGDSTQLLVLPSELAIAVASPPAVSTLSTASTSNCPSPKVRDACAIVVHAPASGGLRAGAAQAIGFAGPGFVSSGSTPGTVMSANPIYRRIHGHEYGAVWRLNVRGDAVRETRLVQLPYFTFAASPAGDRVLYLQASPRALIEATIDAGKLTDRHTVIAHLGGGNVSW